MPPFCYALPAVLFLALCIARTRRALNRIAYTTKANRKQTDKAKARKNESKARSNKTQRKQSKSEKSEGNKQAQANKESRSGYYIKIPSKQNPIKKQKKSNTSIAIYKHLTISKAKKDKQDKEKSKRDPP